MEIDVNPKASEWILKQPWLSQFVDNCVVYGLSPQEILFYLLGQSTNYTINDAFRWSKTPEGRDFWSKIDNEILEVSEEENWDDFDTIIEIR